MIKAVAFDLWETLITDTPAASRAQERLRLERMARILARTPDDIEHAYRRVWHRCQELYWSRDEDIPCRRQIEHFLEELAAGVRPSRPHPPGVSPGDESRYQPEARTSLPDEATIAALEHAYANAAVETLPSVVDGADEVVAALKDRGFLIGMISNTGRTPGYALRQILDRLGLASSIDAMIFSNEHGACKPQRSIFEALRAELGVGYDEMMFVGDNLYVDVHGAKSCGMTAVHFVPPQRGTAIAPAVEHGLEIVPDATIVDLRELWEIVACDPAHAAQVLPGR